MKTSLLMALVFLFGLAHLSSQQHPQQPHPDDDPGLDISQMSLDEGHEALLPAGARNCEIPVSDEGLIAACLNPVTSCQTYFARYRSDEGLPRSNYGAKVQMRAPAVPAPAWCEESVAFNPLTVELRVNSACG